jgi:hypothetical protein
VKTLALILVLLPGLVLGEEAEPTIERIEKGAPAPEGGWFLNDPAMESTDAFLEKVQKDLAKAQAERASLQAQNESLQASVKAEAAKPGLSPTAVILLVALGALLGGGAVALVHR